MASAEYVSMLKEIDIFETIPEEVLLQVAENIQMKKIRKNSLVCKKGDEADEMFVLLAGKINFYDNVHGSIKILGEISRDNIDGDTEAKNYPFFGETALYGSATFQRTAFAKAVTDVVLLCVPSNIVDSMSEHSSAFIERIKTQAKRNLERSKKAKEENGKRTSRDPSPNPSDTSSDRSPSTSSVLLKSRDGNLSLARASSMLHHKSKRRFKRADVELLLKSAYISHKFIQAHLDSIPWDPVDQSISEGDLLQDPMLSPVFNDTLAIKDMQSFVTEVEKIFKCVMREVHGGHNAAYIPILASVDPSKFAISICTVSGQQWSYGDTEDTFSIQSSVKPYMYAKGIEENGIKKMRQHIGIEPSGLAFNAVTLNKNNRAHNVSKMPIAAYVQIVSNSNSTKYLRG